MQKQCTGHTKFFYTIAMHYKKLYYIILINEIIITSYITIYTDYKGYYTAVQLKMYGKFGQSKWILVGRMLKLVRKWPMADCYF